MPNKKNTHNRKKGRMSYILLEIYFRIVLLGKFLKIKSVLHVSYCLS